MSAANERRIYGIEPGKYTEEEIAVAFARTSRVPGSVRDSLNVLTEEKSAEFAEKWVVGYGHSSVAEHAVLHIAVENASRLAVEDVQARRLASFTEQSTRFQKRERGSYYTPSSVGSSNRAIDYEAAHDKYWSAYEAAWEAVNQQLQQLDPVRPGETEKGRKNRLSTKTNDLVRGLLPASTLATMGITMNARTAEYMISQLASSELPESREIGEEIKAVALTIAPTLVKYADRLLFLVETNGHLKEVTQVLLPDKVVKDEEYFSFKPRVDLVDFDRDGETNYLTTTLYRQAGGYSFEECRDKVLTMTADQKELLLETALGGLGPHDKPLRDLEMINMKFDVLLDQGGYYDFKRNRMHSTIPQRLNGAYGAALPKIMEEVGVADQAQEAIRFGRDLAADLESEFGVEAEYLMTNTTLRRVLLSMNLRQLFEFVRTRGAENTNPSYRQAALRMEEYAREKYPTIWKYMDRVFNHPDSETVGKNYYG